MRSYPIKPRLLEAAKLKIQHWLDQDIIERSESSYVSPLLFIEKKNGEIRPCIDARHLNNRTLPEYDCPPKIHEIFQYCKDTKFISTIDLKSSFLQVALENSSKQYTAFQVLGQTYQFTQVPAALKTRCQYLSRY